MQNMKFLFLFFIPLVYFYYFEKIVLLEPQAKLVRAYSYQGLASSSLEVLRE